MLKKTVFLSTILLHSLTTSFCCHAMEIETLNVNNVIPLTNGLLTQLEAKIAQTDYFWLKMSQGIISTTHKTDTLINLLRYSKPLDTSKGSGSYELFCPILLKESEGLIKNLGQFNYTKHYEAIEAMREHKAIYCPLEQGVIIYSTTQQPAIETYITFYKTIKQLLAIQGKYITIFNSRRACL